MGMFSLTRSAHTAAPAAATQAAEQASSGNGRNMLRSLTKLAAALAAALGLATPALADAPGEWEYMFQVRTFSAPCHCVGNSLHYLWLSRIPVAPANIFLTSLCICSHRIPPRPPLRP